METHNETQSWLYAKYNDRGEAQITLNVRQASSSSVCLPHTCNDAHTQQVHMVETKETNACSKTHTGAQMHSMKARRSRRRLCASSQTHTDTSVGQTVPVA